MTALHIFMREFKRYFLSPIGYFVMLGFLLFNGLIFYIIITIESQRYQSAATMDALTILMTGIIFMLTAVGVIPAITMHLFAEEKRSGTMEQLLTAPVTDLQVVLGKYFAAWVFYMCLWIPTLLYLGILLLNVDDIGAVELGTVWGSYLGVVLMSLAFVGVGTMFSSFTRSQILSFILTFSFLIVIFFVGFAPDYLREFGIAADVLGYIGAHKYMEDFGRGLLELRAAVYFLSISFLAIFITIRSLEARKWR